MKLDEIKPEDPQSSSVRKFRCSDCGKEFDAESSLGQHKNDAHGSNPQAVKVPKAKMSKGKLISYLVLGLVVAGIGYGVYTWGFASGGTGNTVNIGPLGSTHIHADYAIYVNGEQVDFSAPTYFQRNSYTHMHQPYSILIHVHATGVTLGYFLESIGVKVDANCLEIEGQKYCNDGQNTVKVFFKNADGNWQQSLVYGNYIIQDLDKFLITYGNEPAIELQEQQNSVTSLAVQASTGQISG